MAAKKGKVVALKAASSEGGSDFAAMHAASEEWADRLMMKTLANGREVPDDGIPNIVATLRFHPAWRDVLAFDVFRQTIVTTQPPAWHPFDAPPKIVAGAWTDADSVRLMSWLRREPTLRMKAGRDTVDAGLLVASEGNPIDPPRAYLDGCKWDAASRVDSWLTDYLGVPDSLYTRWVGRWFLISAVARIYAPGCKVDTALVLEGAQGAMKSSAARALFGEWYSDTPLDLASKDRFGAVQGVWGYELAEFDQYSRHEASIIKAFASSASDKYRPPYMRRDVVVPRRCVFFATINPAQEYLHDETGGRRWWPVRAAKEHPILLDELRRDRDLLWAEARELYLCGERWYPTTPEEHDACRSEQADRQSRDAWEEPIRDWLRSQYGDELTLAEVLEGALQLDKSRWGRAEQMRASSVLRTMGYVRHRVSTGSRGYVYRRANG
jgi:putative DNA primase/helicase